MEHNHLDGVAEVGHCAEPEMRTFVHEASVERKNKVTGRNMFIPSTGPKVILSDGCLLAFDSSCCLYDLYRPVIPHQDSET